MTIESWITFVVIASLILIVPGPTIIYVVGQSLFHGKKSVIPLTSGVVLGDATCILFSLLGLSGLLAISSVMFTVIKLVGAGYLIYLGLSMLNSSIASRDFKVATEEFHAKLLFRNVFAVSALNPKGIVFYSAFMPQFTDPTGNVFNQFLIIGSTFLVLALFNTLCYSLLSGQLAQAFRSHIVARWFNCTGGVALVAAGVLAATVDRK
ncbi:LysE family translocator [Caldithrix abyssi]|nr:LysE family translocator [Caldithrix abyssi]